MMKVSTNSSDQLVDTFIISSWFLVNATNVHLLTNFTCISQKSRAFRRVSVQSLLHAQLRTIQCFPVGWTYIPLKVPLPVGDVDYRCNTAW